MSWVNNFWACQKDLRELGINAFGYPKASQNVGLVQKATSIWCDEEKLL